MTKTRYFQAWIAMLTLGFVACNPDDLALESSNALHEHISLRTMNERVVTADRASGTITVIDAASNSVIDQVTMPDGGEPMYAVHIPQASAVFVGDRANNRVVAFDEDDHSVKGTVPAGHGVFHMWASPNNTELWVNNDIDNTTTIINPISMTVRGTAATPADLVALGGKPHDVFVDPEEHFAYVTVLGVSGANDYVVKYKSGSFKEVDRVAVGKDPHLFADDVNGLLYVPCQNTNEVYVLDRATLDVEDVIAFAGAHGIFMPNSGSYVYVADIPGSQLGLIDIGSNMVLDVVATPFPVPHNLTINNAEDKLFVTHSGATSDKLSIYSLDPEPVHMTDVAVGLNPFGIVYYSY